MKKIFVLAIAACALTLSSCGNKTQKAAPADSTNVETTDSAKANALSGETKTTVDNITAQLLNDVKSGDKTKVISSLANLETIYKNLVDAGKLDEAKSYGSAIQAFVNEHATEIKNVASGNTTIADLINGIANLPTTAEATADEAKKAVTSDVTSLASPVIAKGATAVATAKEAANLVENAPTTVKNTAQTVANQAVESAKTEAENKANEAVNKASEKAQKSVEKAQKKANDAVNNAANKALKGLGL